MTRSARARGVFGACALGFASSKVARELLRSEEGRRPELWVRTNHRGEPISLAGGPSLTIGLLDGMLSGHLLAGNGLRGAVGQVIAVAGAGAFGLLDDLGEKPEDRAKGLRGHLGALAKGSVTTGALKVLGIGASAALASATTTRRTGSAAGYLVDLGANTVLIAGSANLLNLLDLRPGRALKVGALGAVLLLPSDLGATGGAVLGAGAASIGSDLAEQDMLGDCGANALGAALGAGATTAPRALRLGLLAAVVGLTMVSEHISFSRVIENTGFLRAIDMWGRDG